MLRPPMIKRSKLNYTRRAERFIVQEELRYLSFAPTGLVCDFGAFQGLKIEDAMPQGLKPTFLKSDLRPDQGRALTHF
jgi:hypothetical protein